MTRGKYVFLYPERSSSSPGPPKLGRPGMARTKFGNASRSVKADALKSFVLFSQVLQSLLESPVVNLDVIHPLSWS